MRLLLRFPTALVWATGLPLWLKFLDVPLDWLGAATVLAGLGAFYATKGRTLSDLLTRTRVVYLMPPDERRG